MNMYEYFLGCHFIGCSQPYVPLALPSVAHIGCVPLLAHVGCVALAWARQIYTRTDNGCPSVAEYISGIKIQSISSNPNWRSRVQTRRTIHVHFGQPHPSSVASMQSSCCACIAAQRLNSSWAHQYLLRIRALLDRYRPVLLPSITAVTGWRRALFIGPGGDAIVVEPPPDALRQGVMSHSAASAAQTDMSPDQAAASIAAVLL